MADENDVQNNLTLEDPKPAEDPKTDIEGLLFQLESAGITNTEQLEGKLTASSQAGTAFRKLGDAKRRIDALEAAEAERRQNKPAPDWDNDYPGNTTEVDLETTLDKVLDKRENAQLEKQYNADQWLMEQHDHIHSNPRYNMVKELWEAKEADAKFLYGVKTGRINPVQEFNSLVLDYQEGLLKKSHKTISELTGQGKPVTPIVETGQAPSANILSTDNTGDDKHEKLVEKVDKGYMPNEDEQMAALEALLKK